ncbi:methylmalonyl-CoA mutase family protein [Streptomyces sp. NBC_00340]|uniref:methylmalonyl-CoA mutase family protein n=1 Tax=unclassified Streptomyces TaxID=2593676 RepID=UPI00225A87C1|nr:methylmalonyl-CoA mutase family protein [Streptomyces sp. NBC_00340]WSK58418.1 methylmalonyl-CoA mutase family protein [Streptomyces sp. NBC_01281]WSK65803.1 methylmalonyl-CoA mutase family protein [Streptomyces sp. NBC_01281]
MEHTATGAPRPPTEPAYGPRALEPFNPARRTGERGGRGPGEAGRRLGFGEADQWLGEPAAHPPTRVVHPPDPDPGADRAPTWWSSTASGTAAECNARHRKLIAAGVRDLSVVFDVPTRAGHDSDAPAARGEVGRAGVAIDSIDDMRVLFAGIPLEEVVTSMRCGACAAPLLLLYQLVAEEQGAAAGRLSGTFHDGGAGECVPDGDRIFPPGPSARLAADLVRYCRTELPQWAADACRVVRETGPGAYVVPLTGSVTFDGERPEGPAPADPAAAVRQGERIAKLRAWREQRDVDAALTRLKKAAAGDGDVLRPMREALRARATVGEVCDALREVWGIRLPADAR